MSNSPERPSGQVPASPPAGRRNYYAVEIVLGIGLLLMAVLIFTSGNPREVPSGGAPSAEGKGEAHSSHLVSLSAVNWDKEVTKSPVPVLVDFWAPWCGPCRMLSPAIDRLAERYAGKIKVAKLNVDDAPSVAARYDIKQIPKVLLFHGSAQPRELWVNPGNLAATEASVAEELDHILH